MADQYTGKISKIEEIVNKIPGAGSGGLNSGLGKIGGGFF